MLIFLEVLNDPLDTRGNTEEGEKDTTLSKSRATPEDKHKKEKENTNSKTKVSKVLAFTQQMFNKNC